MLIDLNTWFGPWPFKPVPPRSLGQLYAHLRTEGIETAFVSPFNALFYPDPDPCNRELLDAGQTVPGVVPVVILNPHLPGWRAQLAAYEQMVPLKAVKLCPTFHNYRLYTRPVFELVEALAERGIRLLIQLRMEDERRRYFALNVRGLPIRHVVRLHRRYPDVPFVCLNAYLPEARQLGEETDQVGVDLSFAEWLYTIEALRTSLAVERLFFGSHTPLLYTKASVAKLMQADWPEAEKVQIGRDNARAFFDLP